MAKELTSTSVKRDNVVSLTDALESEDLKEGQYIRVQLSLRPEYAKRLEKLRRTSGVRSFAEVVRNSLKQYEQIQQLGSDVKLFAEHTDGSKTYILR